VQSKVLILSLRKHDFCAVNAALSVSAEWFVRIRIVVQF